MARACRRDGKGAILAEIRSVLAVMASLRTRLIVLPTAILLLGLIATIGFSVWLGRLRVQAETASGMRLATVLVRAELADIAGDARPGPILARLETALPSVRHVDLLIMPAPDLLAFGETLFVKGDAATVPRFFVRLLASPTTALSFPILRAGSVYGTVILMPNPLDEMWEIWGELRFLAALLAALALTITAILVALVHFALAPISDLAEALDQLERGRFDIALAPIRVRELRRIGARFDSLARSLGRLNEDNHRLIDKLMSLQEEERKELAHELHDAFGPALFAIRADVAGILRALRGPAPVSPAIAERARAIAGLTDGIQGITTRLLERLRPLVLDELGLDAALDQVFTAWQSRYPELRCTLEIEPVALGRADEALALALYRAVQECLTNIVRHAGASALRVRLRALIAEDGGVRLLELTIADNGRGFAPDQRFGFGLLGMSERARGLGGEVRIGAGSPEIGRAGKGARVEMSIPLQAATVAAS